jgi:hypothetical protein
VSRTVVESKPTTTVSTPGVSGAVYVRFAALIVAPADDVNTGVGNVSVVSASSTSTWKTCVSPISSVTTLGSILTEMIPRSLSSWVTASVQAAPAPTTRIAMAHFAA